MTPVLQIMKSWVRQSVPEERVLILEMILYKLQL